MIPENKSFTFWPDSREAAQIAAFTAKDVAIFMHDNQDIIVSYLHELWRTGNMEKMYSSLRIFQQTYKLDPMPIIDESVPTSVAVMCLSHGVSTDEATKFLMDTYEVIFKFKMEIDFLNSLPDELSADKEDLVNDFMKPFKRILQRQNARNN